MHLGGVRSALYSWLLAQRTGGTFILRLEDTDRERLVPEAAEHIIESLRWLGLNWTEGPDIGGPHAPYLQSERLKIYKQYADQLVESGALYPCWCAPERLQALRAEAQAVGVAFKYDRHCLTHPGDPREPHVLRFRVPDSRGAISWDDAVWGPVSIEADTLDDFVAIKSDSFPTYNFAVIIDDHLMEITHVLRGAEFIPTTPKNILVYEALGWQAPTWVHLPSVLGPDKTKLSKRHGAQPVLDYREAGYLPDAVINYLALIGWNEGEGSTREFFTRPELTAAFSLERIQKSPAVFDRERLDWMNGLHIRDLWQRDPDELLRLCEPFWPASAASASAEQRRAVLALVYDRLKHLSELPELTEFFFAMPAPNTELLTKHYASAEASAHLTALAEALATVHGWTAADLEAVIRPLTEQLNLKTGQLFGLVRAAVTGRTAAPGLFDTLAAIGKDQSLRRLSTSAAILSASTTTTPNQ
jgi:glutamyl-tRNA synthetase